MIFFSKDGKSIQLIDKVKDWGQEHQKLITNLMFISVTLTACILYFTMLYNYDLISDDFGYLNITGVTPSKPVESINDIFISQYNHYFLWGGRSVAHFFVQFLLLIGQPFCSIITSVVIVLFAFLMCKNISGNKKISLTSWMFVLSSIYLINPAFEENIKWITGAGNYLYTLTIIMAFILPYRMLMGNKKEFEFNIKHVIYAILMFLLGILSGWGNENSSVALVLTLAMCFIVYYIKNKNINIPLWCYSGFIGAFIGFIVMLIAPGNFVRNEAIVNKYGSIIKIILQRAYMMERALFGYLWFYVLAVTLIILCAIFIKKVNISNVEWMFVFFGFLSYASMIASPTYPSRATVCTAFILMVAFFQILYRIIDHNKAAESICFYAAAFMFISFFCQTVTEILLPFFKVL